MPSPKPLLPQSQHKMIHSVSVPGDEPRPRTPPLVALGEAMLRLSTHEGLDRAERLDVHVAGSESNVAVALAQLGWEVSWFSALPDTLESTPADMTVIVGVTHTSIAESVRLARHAQEHGAAGVLCASPFYFENSPVGLRRFFEELDGALEIDVVLDDNPATTKTKLAVDDVIAWATEAEHVRTLKLTTTGRRSQCFRRRASPCSPETTQSCSVTSTPVSMVQW